MHLINRNLVNYVSYLSRTELPLLCLLQVIAISDRLDPYRNVEGQLVISHFISKGVPLLYFRKHSLWAERGAQQIADSLKVLLEEEEMPCYYRYFSRGHFSVSL